MDETFVQRVALAKGEVSTELLLEALVERFASRNDYAVTPRTIATVFYEVLEDVRTARTRLAAQKAEATNG